MLPTDQLEMARVGGEWSSMTTGAALHSYGHYSPRKQSYFYYLTYAIINYNAEHHGHLAAF